MRNQEWKRSDTHAAALRAAAKVAFSVAFIGGCGGRSTSPDLPTGSVAGNEANERGTKQDTPPPAGTSTQGAPSPGPTANPPPSQNPPPADCEAVVGAAFPTEGPYPGTLQAVSEEVQACCADLLVKSEGAMPYHRWDCCANLPPNPPEGTGIACTPWGPPVPPSMPQRLRQVA
jgi:hypothetical protein